MTMSKQYKLKKWYPSLQDRFKEGDMVFKADKWNAYTSKEGMMRGDIVCSHEVEENPEFWEEVIEKDYEILKFKSSNTDDLCELRGDGKYHYTWNDSDRSGSSLEAILKIDTWRIYSIKRLSDGEVFTIGDYITSDHYNDPRPISKILLERGGVELKQKSELLPVYGGKTSLEDAVKVDCSKFKVVEMENINTIKSIKRLSDDEVFSVGDKICETRSMLERSQKYVTIDSFEIYKDLLKINIETGFISHDLSTFSKMRHYKEPLFTTHDGVEIRVGDSYTFVWKSGKKWLSSTRREANLQSGNARNSIYFSSEVKAKAYIKAQELKEDREKPIYSKKNIDDALKDVGHLGIRHTPSGSSPCRLIIDKDLLEYLDGHKSS